MTHGQHPRNGERAARKAGTVALQHALERWGDEHQLRAALNVWLYGMAYLPTWGNAGKPRLTLRREQKVTRLAASLLRLEGRYGRQDKDFRRLESVLSYGLERRVGERLTSTAGRVYSALLRVGCDAPKYGVCRLCHRVFRRTRPSVKGSPFCSESCRKARLPHRRVTDLHGVSWVAVPGPRFAASDEDIKHRLVEAYCPDCYAEAEDEKDERVRLGSAFFWADTDRRVYCERHGPDAARAARYKRKHG